MILTILLIIVTALLVFLAALLFAPLQANVHFLFDGVSPSGWAQFSFIHPGVVSIQQDFTSGKTRVRILGLFGRRKTKKPFDIMVESDNEHVDVPKMPDSSLVKTTETDMNLLKNESTPDLFDQKHAEGAFPPKNVIDESKKSSASNNYDATFFKNSDPDDRTAFRYKEKVAHDKEKKDNWLEKMRNNLYLAFILDKKWRGKTVRVIVRFFRSLFFLVRFDVCSIYIKGGVENPAITGTIAGLFNAAECALWGRKDAIFRFEPVFMKNHIEGSASIGAKTSLATLFAPIVIVLVSLPYFSTLVIWLKHRRRKKQHLKVAVA